MKKRHMLLGLIKAMNPHQNLDPFKDRPIDQLHGVVLHEIYHACCQIDYLEKQLRQTREALSKANGQRDPSVETALRETKTYTQIMRDIAEREGIPVVDIRMAEADPSDLVGDPEVVSPPDIHHPDCAFNDGFGCTCDDLFLPEPVYPTPRTWADSTRKRDMLTLADRLDAGAEADIWYDADSFGDDCDEQYQAKIEDAQQAMTAAAALLRRMA